MKKNKVKTIKLAKDIGTLIFSRDVIRKIGEDISSKNTSKIILDFDEVEFVSRSAVHQLLLLRREFEQKSVETSFVNINDRVNKMIRAVINSIENPNDNNDKNNKIRTVDIQTLIRKQI